MTSCSRTMTIKSAFELSAYWRFDENYAGGFIPSTWTDDVQGIQVLGFENNCYLPGLYVRGRTALNWGFNDETGLKFDSTKDGFSIWFWFKKTTATNPTQVFLYIDSYTAPPDSSYRLLFTFTPGTSILKCDLTTALDDFVIPELATVSVTPSWVATYAAQGWCFCCATYTTADKKIRIYTDGGPPAVSASTATMYDMPDGAISFFQVGAGLAAIDEMGVSMTQVLSDDQVNSLYNGGLGMTWPDVENL